MTDTNKQPLEIFNESYEDCDEREATYVFTHREIGILKAALQPKPSVDVEGLKCNVEELIGFDYGDFDIDVVKLSEGNGWDNCINYLHSQGYLNQGWQPIESAPRDGTMILVYKDKKVSIVKWIDGDSICKGAFFKTNSVFYYEEYLTHWMPLPQPPKSEDK